MSLIIDGMDQTKSFFLRLKRDTSATAKLHKVQVSVIGSLCHSHTPHAQAHLICGDYPKDSSLACQVLANTLKNIIDKSGYLPATLYLQLDNTARENKNSTLLLFLRLLVKIGMFKKVISLCVFLINNCCSL